MATTQSTDPELAQQLLAAAVELNRALAARPRDQVRIDAARAELDRLRAIRDGV